MSKPTINAAPFYGHPPGCVRFVACVPKRPSIWRRLVAWWTGRPIVMQVEWHFEARPEGERPDAGTP